MPTPRQPKQIRKCVCGCGNKFETTKNSVKIYYSEKCRERDKKQKLYTKRRTEGLCPQCGNELIKSMDRRGEHCDYCAKKFHRYHEERKG